MLLQAQTRRVVQLRPELLLLSCDGREAGCLLACRRSSMVSFWLIGLIISLLHQDKPLIKALVNLVHPLLFLLGR